jgi:uncharacterized protein YaeQ
MACPKGTANLVYVCELFGQRKGALQANIATMAIKSTIFRAELQIADTDRNYYQDHALTLARHPSETDERLMMRVFAFALNAHEALAFGNGLSADDEPDLWRRDLTGAIEQWIEIGLPDEKALRKACGRANEVIVYSYGGQKARLWWEQTGGKLERFANLRVVEVAAESSQAMAKLAQRNMRLQCTIQEGHVLFTDGKEVAQVEPLAR